MNERIRLLKHQASLWCDENIPEQFSEETNSYGRAWEDKFAELIVRESIVDFYRRYLDLESEEDITKQVDRYVKDNFGVGE